MKKITILFILIILISLISCDTLTHYTARISVERNPTLTIVNQTGYPVVITSPLSANVDNGSRSLLQPADTNQNFDVTYRIGQIEFTEQVTMNDADASVTLIRRPPEITVLNQTGYQVIVTAPVPLNINSEANTKFLSTALSQNIGITYRIGQVEFTEQVTVNNADVSITLTRRPPIVTVVNRTGRQITIREPMNTALQNGENTSFLSPILNQNFNITYSSGQMHLTEEVPMRNQDVTVNLTIGAPTLTIVNNTGTGNNVNIIQFRTPGSVAWTGGNIIIRDNELRLADGTAQTGVTTQVLANGERLSLWLGNLTLSGNAFDIRLQTTNGTIIQKDNVRITSDMTLTFTQSDRR